MYSELWRTKLERFKSNLASCGSTVVVQLPLYLKFVGSNPASVAGTCLHYGENRSKLGFLAQNKSYFLSNALAQSDYRPSVNEPYKVKIVKSSVVKIGAYLRKWSVLGAQRLGQVGNIQQRLRYQLSINVYREVGQFLSFAYFFVRWNTGAAC